MKSYFTKSTILLMITAYSASATTPSDNYSPYYSPEETVSSSVSDDTDYYNPTSYDEEDSYLDSSLDDNGDDIDVYDDPGFLSFVERGGGGSRSSFKRFRGNGCRTHGGGQGRNGREYQLHRRTSRSQCEKKCLDFGSRCTGYEYDSIQRNCEVWRVNIDPSQTRRANVRGLDCYIKEEKKNDQCFRSSPRVNSNGQRFQFKLENSRDSKCVDRHRQFYEYGQFQDVDSFDSCARTCVNNVNSSLLRHFQGIDFNCEAKACNCLYDSGTLNNRNSRRFDRTVTRFNGVGRVQNTRFAKGFACGSVNLIVNRRGPAEEE